MKADRTLRRYTILSSGNVDLLHAAVANALWIGADPRTIAVFEGAPKLSREERLCAYLERRVEERDFVEMLIFDNMQGRRFKRFKVLNFGFFQAFLHYLTDEVEGGACDILYLPIVPIASENEEWTYHGIRYFEGVEVAFGDIGALCLSKTGAEHLLRRLRGEGTRMPGVFCLKEAPVKPYEWRYERGAYD